MYALARTWVLLALTLPALVVGGVPAMHAADVADDAAMIRRVINETWDKPDAQVQIDPVVVSGDAAIASWAQGDHGGRALMRKRAGQWHVVLCSGDPLKSADVLREANVPAEQAVALAHAIEAAEAALPKERVAMFSRFQGLVPMDATPHNAHPHR